MAMNRAYLDYNATAPLRPEARAAVLAALDRVGNASSIHGEGRAARKLVEAARTEVAALVGAAPGNVTFTGGGTEANVTVLTPEWTLAGRPLGIERLLVSAVEHVSVIAGGRFPAGTVEQIPVDGDGVVRLDALRDMLARPGKALVSVMVANNETGVVQPLPEVAQLAREAGALLHADAIQAAGRMPLDIQVLGADVLTLSAHKIGGPQGVGAIVTAGGALAFRPLLAGGGQERRNRAGTENVAGIAGFGAAAGAALSGLGATAGLAVLRDQLADIARESGLKVTVFGANAPRLPQTLCLGIDGISAETLVIALDLEGIAASSGSACSSGKVAPSHVLAAMGVPERLAKGAIRLSLGWDSRPEDIHLFSTAWRRVLKHVAPGDIAAA